MNDREAYIALNLIGGVGPVTVRRLAEALGSPAAIFSASPEELAAVRGVGEKTIRAVCTGREEVDPAAEEKRAARAGARIITPADEEYPPALREIPDPPLALYVRGELTAADRRAVAVVGSRATSHYGLSCADRFAFELARSGFTVVSGLARGTDTAAHRGALKAKGRTVAVLGGALDRLYPPENAELAEEIARSGALVSEYPMGRPPDRLTFPYRNRIISGLSMGVLVIESGRKGGAMHTADAAMEQGRTVFALPGRVDTPGSRGPHFLIKNGAKLVERVEDILEEFEWLVPPVKVEPARVPAARPTVPLDAREQRVIEALWNGPLDTDSLCRAADLSAAELGSLLLGLEMKRVVRILPGRIVELAGDLRAGFETA